MVLLSRDIVNLFPCIPFSKLSIYLCVASKITSLLQIQCSEVIHYWKPIQVLSILERMTAFLKADVFFLGQVRSEAAEHKLVLDTFNITFNSSAQHLWDFHKEIILYHNNTSWERHNADSTRSLGSLCYPLLRKI